MAKILLLNGPNLNLLGTREPGIYGQVTLAQIEHHTRERAELYCHSLVALQSNSEVALIERVHVAKTDGTAFIVLNPAAFTHTSVALRDALSAAAIPFVEVHISNVHGREAFRRQSFFSDLAVGVICGFGAHGYLLAIDAAATRLAALGADGEAVQTGI